MFKSRSRPIQNQGYNLPAPVEGVDSTSLLMQMPAKRAVILENWFPRPDALVTRPGYASHVTGLPSAPKRFHTYNPASGGGKIFVSTNLGFYDVTTAGAVGAVAMALTNGDSISTLIATGAGHYLLSVNGTDTLKQYDGAAWSSVAVLGAVSTVGFSYITTYRQRIFLAKKNSLEISYLGANSISGAPTDYPLGAIFPEGGYIVALGTWTIDGGTGPEDNLAVLSSTGHVAVFAGADPATWSRKGTYYIGTPLGKTPLQQYGGDLLCLTETGVVPLSSVVQSTAIDRVKTFTQNIRPFFNAAAAAYSANHGWEILVDPLAPMVLVNVPSTPIRKQAVMHSQTGAWTFYTGWDAQCFGKKGSTLYFASVGTVFTVGGTSDNGANITATFSQAYNRLGLGANKCLKLLRPYFETDGTFTYSIGISSDFQDAREKTYLNPTAGAGAALWGTAVFNTSFWSGSSQPIQPWLTVPDEYTLWKSLEIQVVTLNAQVVYAGSDLLLTPGGNF